MPFTIYEILNAPNRQLVLYALWGVMVKNSKGQSFEESVTMEAVSDIRVGPMSKYLATVKLEERAVDAKFQVRVRMSMPQGRAPIYIRRKSDNMVAFVFNVKNLVDIFFGDGRGRFDSAEKVRDGETVVFNKVDFLVEGFVKGNIACDHTINLTSDETQDEKNQAKSKRFQN